MVCTWEIVRIYLVFCASFQCISPCPPSPALHLVSNPVDTKTYSLSQGEYNTHREKYNEMSATCEQSYLFLANCKCVSCIVQKFSGQILMFRTLHPVDTQTYNLLQNYITPTGFKEYINCYSCKIHQKYIKNHLYIFFKGFVYSCV